MPFPLAHPAAALPLRRWCPRYLSFPALIVGCLAPDAGYAFSALHMGAFSHRLIGSVAFCLPVGLATVLVLHAAGPRLAPLLPAGLRDRWGAVCQRPLGSWWALSLSVVIGALLHIFWDSFTHKDGWLTEHWAFLQWPVCRLGGRRLRMCHLLWYASTFGGVAWLFMVYEQWLRAGVSSPARLSFWRKWRDALLMAALVLPVAGAHHLVRHPGGEVLVLASSVVLVIGFSVWAASGPRGPGT